MKKIVSLVALAGAAAMANAQSFEANGATIRFETSSDGVSWSSNTNINPGDTAQWRVVVSYTGTRTDLFALGQAIYQPMLGGVDNTGPALDNVNVGAAASGNNIANSVIGQPGGSATTGRHFPYALAAMQASTFNATGFYRHSGGSNGAPAGDWIRVTGQEDGIADGDPTETWPGVGTTVVTADLQRILRGVQNNQPAQALNPSQHQAGLSNLVLFTGTFTASTDTSVGNRVVSVSTDESTFSRWGNASSTDNRRYFAWQTGSGDTGTGATGHRTSVSIQGGTITIVPTPASIALMGLGGLIAARRRRA
jgi:hypothetical protein